VKYEESFGVIPLSKKSGSWEVFLIQHNRGHYWGFPKGHAEAGETNEEAACRELKEETHLDVVRFMQSEPFVEQYQFLVEGKKISKRVSYFAAEVSGDVQLQLKEIQDGIWLPILTALDKVTHREGKSILSQVAKILP
jgi:8-oxo-dGTP pyrophosphatase MutT (NUDIX family)